MMKRCLSYEVLDVLSCAEIEEMIQTGADIGVYWDLVSQHGLQTVQCADKLCNI